MDGKETEIALVESVVSAAQLIEISTDGPSLVRRLGEVSRKSSSRETDCCLGANTSRPSDGSNEGT